MSVESTWQLSCATCLWYLRLHYLCFSSTVYTLGFKFINRSSWLGSLSCHVCSEHTQAIQLFSEEWTNTRRRETTSLCYRVNFMDLMAHKLILNSEQGGTIVDQIITSLHMLIYFSLSVAVFCDYDCFFAVFLWKFHKKHFEIKWNVYMSCPITNNRANALENS